MNMGSRDLTASKIVLLIGHFGRGGSERQAYLLARELRRRQLNAEVWALTFSAEYAREFEAAGVPTRALGFEIPIEGNSRLTRAMKWPLRLRYIVQQLRKAQVEILLPFTTWPNVVAGLSYRFAGVRVCIWGERHCGVERLPAHERLAVRLTRRFIANSTAGVEFLARELRAPRQRISLVPNGVEQPPHHDGSDWRRKLGVMPGQPLVVKVANVNNRKGHATLLRAWKIVQENWSSSERPFLALAGAFSADDVFAECEKIIRDGNLATTVRFLGSISDVASLIAACDLAVLSSWTEGMPNGVLECMAAGKAVIASDLPGVRDALGRDTETLASPGDVKAFAQLMLDLLRDPERCRRIGEANRMRMKNQFSVERMADRYLRIVREEWDRSRSDGTEPAGHEARA
jgi:glycosyltransferase involved in cell wall biosynthesis